MDAAAGVGNRGTAVRTTALLAVVVGVWLALPARSAVRIMGSRRRNRGRLTAQGAAATVAGLGAALFVGGMVGVVVGVIVGVAARTLLRRIATDDSDRRKALARQSPDAVDCLASCLSAGAPLWSAITVVADAFGDPLAAVLKRCAGRHALGASHADTFAELLVEPSLAPVGRVLLRSVESGGALTRSLVACAQHMRVERAGELERRARAVGVKAVAPLGLCFLPAFVLLAVVPIVGSMVQSLF